MNQKKESFYVKRAVVFTSISLMKSFLLRCFCVKTKIIKRKVHKKIMNDERGGNKFLKNNSFTKSGGFLKR